MSAREPSRPLGCTSANALKLFACVCMIIDHIGYTGLLPYWWLRAIGRLAFPIFCFFIVEGYFHTRSLWRYLARLCIFSLLCEIPFDLMSSGGRYTWDLGSQNVFFTLALGLIAIAVLDYGKKLLTGELSVGNRVLSAVLGAVLILASCTLPLLTARLIHCDYGYLGVLCVIALYITRGHPALSFVALALIFELLSNSYSIAVPLFGGAQFSFKLQTLGALAAIPFVLYNGKLGAGGKAAKWAFYLFYPVHSLVLALLCRL